MKQDWTWWQKALRNPQGIGKTPDLPVHDSEPQAGFYRVVLSKKDGLFEPVAFWRDDDGAWVCLRGWITPSDGLPVVRPRRAAFFDADPLRVWSFACRRPISKKLYDAVAKAHEPWPDEPRISAETREAVNGQKAEAEEIEAGRERQRVADDEARHGVGGNEPPDEFAMLAAEIREWTLEAKRLMSKEIASQAECDQVANLSTKMREFENAALRHRRDAKKPLEEQLAEIERRWKPLEVEAAVAKDSLKRHMAPWLLKSQAAIEEARKREMAEKGEEVGAPPPKARAGSRGRSQSLRSFKVAKITDYKATLEFFADHPDIKSAVKKLADANARAGVIGPGYEIVEEQKVV